MTLLISQPQPSRAQWPTGANDTPARPIVSCPSCGAQSSGDHVCRRPTKTTERGRR